MLRHSLGLLCLCLAATGAASAEVRLPNVLGDHMVIQRGLPVHIWGRATPGESVTVALRGQTRQSTADDIGRWSVYLPPMEAGGPFEITIQGANKLVLRDVLVGDVWVASGQSNMEFPLSKAKDSAAESAAAKYPRIRLYHVKNKSADHPMDDAAADPWVECSPKSAARFSAVAYFFGRKLHQDSGVPIGLISTSWGGTPAEAWTSLSALSADSSLMPVFAEWAKATNDQVAIDLRRANQLRDYEAARAKAKSEGRPEPGYPWAPNLEKSWMPAGLYNGMIAPLTPFPIRGALWYQGESNAGPERATWYSRLFATMITDWRRAWGQGDFPFVFVQLANYKTGPQSMWPELRDQQTQTLRLNNTGMAVTIDIGDPVDIHPTNKQDVGLRLALAAQSLAYGATTEFSGPLFRLARPEGATMRVWFDHAAGLVGKGGPLRGFEIAGADHKFVPAEARVDGATLVVSAPSVPAPQFVRYAWADDPSANLVNAAGLPASPFRSSQEK
jgi:sialate O-acetylesterase